MVIPEDARIENELERAKKGDLEIESIPSEEEDYESSPPCYDISTYPADYTLEVLYSKWKDNEIKIPDFQRGFVWKQIQAAKLIESFLVGLPVPSVFLYSERKSNDLLVIDGQQRLKSIFYFFEGYFGPEESGKRKIFKLLGLSPKSKYANLSFSSLPAEEQKKYKNCVLRAFIVQQKDPEDDTSMYHIFERLNTGGTLLTNQEVRNCIFQGSFVRFLNTINTLKEWRSILGKPLPDSRKKDFELLVRYFAMLNISKYEKPMKDYLSTFMKKNKNLSEGELSEMLSSFEATCGIVTKHLGPKPFNVKTGLNIAVFDSVMTAIANNLDSIPEDLNQRYIDLLGNDDFQDAIRDGTTDKDKIERRFSIAKRYLFS